MKKLTQLILLFLFLLFLSIDNPVQAEDTNNDNDYLGTVVYLDNPYCEYCGLVLNHGVISGLRDQGFQVIVYNVQRLQDAPMAARYAERYCVKPVAPVLFAGSKAFYGPSAIIEGFDNGVIQQHAQDDLLDISEIEIEEYGFWIGLGMMIIGGLIDSLNPCAIAMLLMFISMVGFTKNRKVLMLISVSYIGAIFITYFSIGLLFMTILNEASNAIEKFSLYLYLFFAVLCFFLFIITFYDFIITRKAQYGKVKNQLPKVIQNFNKRFMSKLTQAIESDEPSLKQAFLIVIIPAFIGVIVGITEAGCTGQIYVSVLASLHEHGSGRIDSTLILYLLVFNIMFVFPLIVIVFIAIKSKSVVGISNFIRENLSKIKLVTSIFFLLMTVYFVLMLTGNNPLAFLEPENNLYCEEVIIIED